MAQRKSKTRTAPEPEPPLEKAVEIAPEPMTLVHETHGRVRFRLARREQPADAMAALADRLAETDGVARVVVRPHTGSVIVEHRLEVGTIPKRLVEAGAVRLRPASKGPSLDQVAQLGLAQLDRTLEERTQGAVNMHSLLAILLIIGAVAQAARGRVAGPATTLLLSALSLLETSRKR